MRSLILKFRYDDIWRDILALWTQHRAIAIPLIGVFSFLPAFAQLLFIPAPKIEALDWDGVNLAMAYYEANVVPLMAIRMASLLGTAALIYIMLARDSGSVGEALMRALVMLPSLFLLSIILSFAVTTGLFALIVPGLYLLARLLLSEPAMILDKSYNPFDAMAKSLAMTAGQGWRICGIFCVFVLGVWIVVQAIAILATFVGKLLLPVAGMDMLAAALGAVSASAFALVIALLTAVLYRRLSTNSGT